MAFFRDAYFAKVLQMNILYSTETISHIHWQPNVYKTQNTTGQPPCILSLIRGESLGRLALAQCTFALCTGAQLRGYMAVITCLRQFDTILFWAMQQRNHNLYVFYCKTLWDYGPELVQLFSLFCAALHWTQYSFYILSCGLTLDSIKIPLGFFCPSEKGNGTHIFLQN